MREVNHPHLIKLATPKQWIHDNGGNAFGPDGAVRIFYPGGFTDFGPLDLFLGPNGYGCTHGHITAVYADYLIDSEQIRKFAGQVRSRYQAEEPIVSELQAADFGAQKISDFYPKAPAEWSEEEERLYRPAEQKVLGCRFFYRTINLTLIYLQAEATKVYKALNKINLIPNIAVLTEHGYGGFWTQLDGDSVLYNAVTKKPTFLYVQENARPWPGYERISDWFVDEGQMHHFKRSLYRRSKQNQTLSRPA